MRFFYLIILIFLLFLSSCTQNGSEIGLIRNWSIYDLDTNIQNIGGIWGNLVLNCDNTYAFDLNFTINEIEYEHESSGTFVSDSNSKRLHLNCSSYSFKIAGVKQNTEDSDGNFKGYYILQCMDLTFTTENNGADFTFKMTPD